jgi:hypothetical protein
MNLHLRSSLGLCTAALICALMATPAATGRGIGHATQEPSQKVLLVRNLCVDSFRGIDIVVRFESSLACPR